MVQTWGEAAALLLRPLLYFRLSIREQNPPPKLGALLRRFLQFSLDEFLNGFLRHPAAAADF